MKYHFNFFLITTLLTISTVSYSRDVILVENLASSEEGQLLLKIIKEKFNIPKKLITYREIKSECVKNSDAIMHLCLLANGELDIVKKDKFVVEETFRIFTEAGI